jgi:hypothetical protein
MTTLELTPWPAARIRALAGDRGATGAAALDAVVGLSGGIPLLADAVCRALRAGVDPSLTGALADAAATVLLHRLRGEAGRRMAGPLSVVATLDGADDDLLHALVTVPADAFDRLAALSVVVPDVHGLTVAEPYRTVLDLAYQWRHPNTRREIATRGASIRLGQIAAAHVPLRARLADQVLYLSAGKAARGDLFPELRGDLRVRRAEARDADDMGRLVRLWAGHEGLDTRRADRMLELWQSGPEHGFHVAVDPTDRPVGLLNLTPLGAASSPALEPLLQQYADAMVAQGPGMLNGLLSVDPDYPLAQQLLVRHILHESIAAGRVVVSTPWIPYQHLSARFGLRRLGQTRHDIYRCGRSSAVYTRSFAPETLSGWLRRLQGPRPGEPDAQQIAAVRRALAALGSPRSAPLVATPARLRAAIEALLAAADPVDAQAGQVLHTYYVRRAGGHDLVAHRLHLSRATYFRRLEHGLRRIAELIA